MKLFLVTFLIIFGLLNGQSALNAQPNILISITNTNIINMDSAKSVFGLNEVRYTLLNTSNTKVRVRSEVSEFRVGNNSWVGMPDIRLHLSHGDDHPLLNNSSVIGLVYVPIFNLYLDESFNMQSFAVSGGTIDYRLVFAANDGITDSIFYSTVVHIVVPPATSQDAAALQYVIQQKSACPEIEYFFAGADLSTWECKYVYEYLAANFPETALGKVSKYIIALGECRNHRSEINDMPEVKATIINIRNMLQSSDIPYVKHLAKNLTCANN